MWINLWGPVAHLVRPSHPFPNNLAWFWHWSPNIPKPKKKRKIHTNDTMKIRETRLVSFQDQVNVCIAQRGLAPQAASRCNEITSHQLVYRGTGSLNDISWFWSRKILRQRAPKFQSLYFTMTASCRDFGTCMMPHPYIYISICSRLLKSIFDSLIGPGHPRTPSIWHLQQVGVRTP